jgi:hypothetical protein
MRDQMKISAYGQMHGHRLIVIVQCMPEIHAVVSNQLMFFTGHCIFPLSLSSTTTHPRQLHCFFYSANPNRTFSLLAYKNAPPYALSVGAWICTFSAKHILHAHMDCALGQSKAQLLILKQN